MTTGLEFYREKFKIIEWKDGAIYKTKSLGCDWFSEKEILVHHKSILYVVADDVFAQNNSTVRRIRK